MRGEQSRGAASERRRREGGGCAEGVREGVREGTEAGVKNGERRRWIRMDGGLVVVRELGRAASSEAEPEEEQGC
jgi:hypothetical protein